MRKQEDAGDRRVTRKRRSRVADWPTVRDSTALEEERGKEGGRREQSSEHWQCGGSEGNAAGGSWTDRRPGYHETYWPSRLTTLGGIHSLYLQLFVLTRKMSIFFFH